MAVWSDTGRTRVQGRPQRRNDLRRTLLDQGRVSADNAVERLPSYDNKRIFLVCGLDEDVNETPVRAGQREFRGLLTSRGTPHEWYGFQGRISFAGRLQKDVDGVIARLKKA